VQVPLIASNPNKNNMENHKITCDCLQCAISRQAKKANEMGIELGELLAINSERINAEVLAYKRAQIVKRSRYVAPPKFNF